MSSSTRERWRFLQTLHPLFLFAESLPTIEAADHGHHDSATVDGVGDLTKDIVTLRSGLKLNVIKQRLVDIDQLTEDDPTVEGLELDLQTMLEELERLVSCNVLAFDRLVCSLINAPPNYSLDHRNTNTSFHLFSSAHPGKTPSPAFPSSSHCGNSSTAKGEVRRQTTDCTDPFGGGSTALCGPHAAGVGHIRRGQWHW